jgi:hypothetical protein
MTNFKKVLQKLINTYLVPGTTFVFKKNFGW